MGDGRGIKGVEIGLTVSTFLEGNNVSSSNGLIGFLHINKGRGSRESREDAESEEDEVFGEHVNDAVNVDEKVVKLGGDRVGEGFR